MYKLFVFLEQGLHFIQLLYMWNRVWWCEKRIAEKSNIKNIVKEYITNKHNNTPLPEFIVLTNR